MSDIACLQKKKLNPTMLELLCLLSGSVEIYTTPVPAQADSIAGMSLKSGQKCLLTAVLTWHALEAQMWDQFYAFIPEKQCSM